MKGRTGLDERLIDGQEDLGCLLKSPLSTPSAPTVTSAAPHTPGEREPGNKSHFRKEKEVCVSDVGQEYRCVQNRGAFIPGTLLCWHQDICAAL